MKLAELLIYDNIVIQCHDNPDADAIASGYGLYCYFKLHKKEVQFVYGGKFRIQKSNLTLMVQELEIPIQYVTELDEKTELLLTVDCQYEEGNVTKFEARHIAVIDHHKVTRTLPAQSEVRSNIGSCSTIVWDMMQAEQIDVNENRNLATALYYGLYTDTNSLAEINHPLDKDMQDALIVDKDLVSRMRNSNLSLDEMKLAGVSMLGYEYYEEDRYAILDAEPCDPNILGLISDFFLAVDAVDYCLVYCVLTFGIKFSVRSCRKEVRANELAEFLAKDIGSGGGHVDKAGGFLKKELIAAKYDRYREAAGKRQEYILSDIMRELMKDYFKSFDVVYARKQELDTTGMKQYRKLPLPVGFVHAIDLFHAGDAATVRTLEGDLDLIVSEETYLLIGITGEVYPIQKEKFDVSYRVTGEKYDLELEYKPTVKDTVSGKTQSLLPYAQTCVPTGEVKIRARRLERCMKVFTCWDEDKYMLGKPGDYVAVRNDDNHDIYIIEQQIFQKSYKEV